MVSRVVNFCGTTQICDYRGLCLGNCNLSVPRELSSIHMDHGPRDIIASDFGLRWRSSIVDGWLSDRNYPRHWYVPSPVLQSTRAVQIHPSFIVLISVFILLSTTTCMSNGWTCGFSFTSIVMYCVLYAISPESQLNRFRCESYIPLVPWCVLQRCFRDASYVRKYSLYNMYTSAA